MHIIEFSSLFAFGNAYIIFFRFMIRFMRTPKIKMRIYYIIYIIYMMCIIYTYNISLDLCTMHLNNKQFCL
jgi:hypothetical protein